MEIIKTILDFLNNNQWVNAVFLLLAILGIITTIIFYIKSKKYRLPLFSVRSINLVRERIKKIKSVEILYEGEKVDNLTISRMALWNSGKETINSNDVAKIDPIKIQMKNEAKILDAEMIYQKNKANNFFINIEKEKNEIIINFDYFDCDEGIVIQIYHTGFKSSDIEIKGTIKSTKGIMRKKIPVLSRLPIPLSDNIQNKIPQKYIKYILGWVFIITPFILSPLLFMKENSAKVETNIWSKIIVMSIVSIMYCGFGIYLLMCRIPKGFDVYEEEF